MLISSSISSLNRFAALFPISQPLATRLLFLSGQNNADPKPTRLDHQQTNDCSPFLERRASRNAAERFVKEPFNFEEEYRSALLVEASPGLFTRIVQYKTLLRMKSEASRSRDLADISELRLLHEGKYPNA